MPYIAGRLCAGSDRQLCAIQKVREERETVTICREPAHQLVAAHGTACEKGQNPIHRGSFCTRSHLQMAFWLAH